jgi:hypothetical protein
VTVLSGLCDFSGGFDLVSNKYTHPNDYDWKLKQIVDSEPNYRCGIRTFAEVMAIADNLPISSKWLARNGQTEKTIFFEKDGFFRRDYLATWLSDQRMADIIRQETHGTSY